MLDPYPDLLTVPEVATILRVDRSYVYRMIRQGRLAVLRPTPHKTRILKTELHAFLTARQPAYAPVPHTDEGREHPYHDQQGRTPSGH